jgi:LuxR family quorum sensing-dependent transcriptional regulator
MRFMDITTRCLAATTPAHLGEIISSLCDVVSFEKAALCAIVPGSATPSVGHYVNHSYGTKWAALYTAERFSCVDPILRYGQTRSGAFRWGDARETGLSKLEAMFFEAARDHGLVDGATYACGALSEPSPRTILSLAGVREEEADRALEVLRIVGPHLHEAYRRLLYRPEAEDSASLSRRERDVLNWAQQGKTYWEIGCILGISERTVKFHFARIKSKLDVVTPAHAVAKAMRLGIIA